MPEASLFEQEWAARWERIEAGLKRLNPNFQVKWDMTEQERAASWERIEAGLKRLQATKGCFPWWF